MQPRRLLTLAMMWIILFFTGVNLCFGQIYWKKTYGSGYDAINAIQSTNDGNFLAVGSTNTSYGWIVKIKSNGDTIWTRTFGEEGTENLFSSIEPTSDGNFLVIGTAGNNGWIVKIKSNGDTVWTKKYNRVGFYASKPSNDGNFLISGVNVSGATSNGFVVKINPNGDTIWTKTYGDTCCINMICSIQPTGDGNFLLAGRTGGYGWVIKIKPTGDTLWTKRYSNTSDNTNGLSSIQPTSDGNFILTGYTGINYCWAVKIKTNGDTIWSKTYDLGFFDAIQPSGDGNFILATYSSIVKIHPNGDTIWTRTYSGEASSGFITIQPTKDSNFLIGGIGIFSITCIIADQYAYKNTPFIYKIPTYSTDTLNFGYAPLKVPSGMTVSAGGTVSWTPKTDSVYMDHAEFLVLNDMGHKDTLTFNIFVNSDYHTPVSQRPSQTNKNVTIPFDISATSFPGNIKFYLPPTASSLYIYDITGRIVDKITPSTSNNGTCITWPGDQSSCSKIHAGKYFVKAMVGKNSVVKTFVLVK